MTPPKGQLAPYPEPGAPARAGEAGGQRSRLRRGDALRRLSARRCRRPVTHDRVAEDDFLQIAAFWRAEAALRAELAMEDSGRARLRRAVAQERPVAPAVPAVDLILGVTNPGVSAVEVRPLSETGA